MSEDEKWCPTHPGKGRYRKRGGGRGTQSNGVASSPYKRSPQKNPRCCLPWCPQHDRVQSTDKPRFITFPIQRERQFQWIKILRMEKVLGNLSSWDLFRSYYLCENHFESNELTNKETYMSSLVPTKNLEGALCTFYNQGKEQNVPTVKRENEIYCVVFGCRNQFRDSADCEIALYPFPSDPNRRKLWITNVKRYNQNRSGNPIFENYNSDDDWRNKYICSEHFELHDISFKAGEFSTTFEINPAVVPLIDDDVQSVDTDVVDVDSDQSSAPESGVQHKDQLGVVEESDSGVGNMEVETNPEDEEEADANSQTDPITGRDVKYIPPEIVTLSDDEDCTQITVDDDTTAMEKPPLTIEFTPAQFGQSDQPPTSILSTTTIPIPPVKNIIPNILYGPFSVPVLEQQKIDSTPNTPKIDNHIPLVTKCYAIDAIQERHKTLCAQLNLTRSQLNQIWDCRRSVLSKDVLDED